MVVGFVNATWQRRYHHLRPEAGPAVLTPDLGLTYHMYTHTVCLFCVICIYVGAAKGEGSIDRSKRGVESRALEEKKGEREIG